MTVRTRAYFWFSLAVVTMNVVNIGWPVFKGQALHKYDTDAFLALIPDVVRAVAGLLMLSALYGLSAVFVRRERRFFSGAAALGALGLYCQYEVIHGMDCIDRCTGSNVMLVAALIAGIPGVLMPLILILISPDGNRQAPGQPPKTIEL